MKLLYISTRMQIAPSTRKVRRLYSYDREAVATNGVQYALLSRQMEASCCCLWYSRLLLMEQQLPVYRKSCQQACMDVHRQKVDRQSSMQTSRCWHYEAIEGSIDGIMRRVENYGIRKYWKHCKNTCTRTGWSITVVRFNLEKISKRDYQKLIQKVWISKWFRCWTRCCFGFDLEIKLC